jgi:beta-galactosidase
MGKFCAQDGQFCLDGSPLLIQAGEFHYFRTPKDQWRHRLNLLKEAGMNTLAVYIPWRWHQLEEGVSDFDGHSHPMRDLESFLDLAAEMGLYIIARPGPYIMAETINEGIPDWVFQKYPRVAFISQDGISQNVVAYMQPDFLACVRGWYKAIFEVLAPRQITLSGKIIMVQLDNEMGMIAWVRNIMDTNPDTMTRFADHLKKVYGERLSERYPARALPEFLREGIANPAEPYAANIVEDYRRFYRDYLAEYGQFLWSEAKANGLEVPPIVNIQGFANGGKTFPIGISQLIGVMELEGMVSATDVYPAFIGEGNHHQLVLVNEITKALQNPQQALFSVEFQAGGNNDFSGSQSSFYDLHTRLCISNGMRAINHYLFCDGENDPLLSPVKRHDWGHPVRKDGTLRKHYARYGRLARVLAAYGEDLVMAQPQTVTSIGFFLDHFMTEVNNKFSQEAANILTHQREVILFDLIARGLALTHRPFEAVELERADLDSRKTPLLWVMMEKQCNAAVQKKLVDYVEGGGKLVLIGRMCCEDFHHQECTLLQDALGIRKVEGGKPFVGSLITAFGSPDIPVSFMETYQGDFDEVVAGYEPGRTVGFIKNLGKGKVLVFGAALGAYTLDDLDVVNQMALKMDCHPLFTASEWGDMRLSKGGKGSFLFINNYQDDPLETTIDCGNEALFGGNPIRMPARRGLILPLEWQLNENVTLHYSTAEITGIEADSLQITFKTEPREFSAEMTLKGYDCAEAAVVQESGGRKRVKLESRDGQIRLMKV